MAIKPHINLYEYSFSVQILYIFIFPIQAVALPSNLNLMVCVRVEPQSLRLTLVVPGKADLNVYSWTTRWSEVLNTCWVFKRVQWCIGRRLGYTEKKSLLIPNVLNMLDCQISCWGFVSNFISEFSQHQFSKHGPYGWQNNAVWRRFTSSGLRSEKFHRRTSWCSQTLCIIFIHLSESGVIAPKINWNN